MKESSGGGEDESPTPNEEGDASSSWWRQQCCCCWWWCCCRNTIVPFTPMVPLDKAMNGTTFHFTEEEEEEDNDEQRIARNIRFPFDARAGKTHTCLLFVVKEVHENTRSVPLLLEHVQDIQNTFGAMTLQPNPLHIAKQGLHVFLGICTGQQVMDKWMSKSGRRVFADQLGQYYTLSYVVSVPYTTSTQEAWDGYQKRLSSSSGVPPSPVSGKYIN